MFQEEYYGEHIDSEVYPSDPKTQEVKDLLLKEFSQNPKGVYYQRQLEVWYEKKFFHWVTDRALREQEDEGKIIVDYFPIKVGEHKNRLKIITLSSNRYYRRPAKQVMKLVEEYCSPEITQDVGLIGQEMFKVAYARFGYRLIKEDAGEFNGKVWRRSKKDLDFIVEKNGAYFGCEVKNTLGYIDKNEIDEKIDMCKFFGIIPVFIMRYSPTVWNNEIYEKGGFVQIFDKQIFPPGRKKLVDRLREELKLPVLTSTRIPNSIMDRIDKTINERVFLKRDCEKKK